MQIQFLFVSEFDNLPSKLLATSWQSIGKFDLTENILDKQH
jgi:hypothetical protein